MLLTIKKVETPCTAKLHTRESLLLFFQYICYICIYTIVTSQATRLVCNLHKILVQREHSLIGPGVVTLSMVWSLFIHITICWKINKPFYTSKYPHLFMHTFKLTLIQDFNFYLCAYFTGRKYSLVIFNQHRRHIIISQIFYFILLHLSSGL